MASVTREIIVDVAPAVVWAKLSDFETAPVRMTPGLIVDSRLDPDEPDVRVLTFPDGMIARERFIARDDQARRIVWAWFGEEVVHDNTSMQVFAADEGRSRLVWTHDTLPDRLADWLSTAMDHGVAAIRQTFTAPGGPGD